MIPPGERVISIRPFEPRRVLLRLNFDKDSYDVGDSVEAAVTMTRLDQSSTNGDGTFSTATVRFVASVGGETVFDSERDSSTASASGFDASGTATVRFSLPSQLTVAQRDGAHVVTATVMDRASGIVETISRTLPLTTQIHVDLFPEGGVLVEALPTRVYFEAADEAGDPVDVQGSLLACSHAPSGDLACDVLATATTVHEGRGVTPTFVVPRGGKDLFFHVDRPAAAAQDI